MLRLISSREKEQWDKTVRSYPNWDVYYLCGYARSLEGHEKGCAFLIDFSFGEERVCYPVMEKDISNAAEFQGPLPKGTCFDWETPYGYGGPLSNRERLSLEAQRMFQQELTRVCRQRRVVSQFIRFHPLLQNQQVLDRIIEYKTFKDTVFMDLTSENDIFAKLDGKNRNMVRKARKSGVTVFWDHGERLSEFQRLYQKAMDRVHAQPYYYFDKSYYERMKEIGEDVVFFYAQREGEIVAASIFLYNDRFMHYHLSGTDENYRSFAPTNLLLYEAACWGARRGIRQLHLGGGNANGEDDLFAFKKRFNKNGRLPFYIGKSIFIPEEYQRLLEIRRELELNFDPQNSYFIQYRKPKEKRMRAYIIAEAGVNHNGSLELALKLVDAAKAAGADCVKFQTSITEEGISVRAEKAEYQKETTGAEEGQFEMEKRLELSYDQFRQIKACCDERKIQFLSTPFDIPSVRFLKELDMPFWKIPSGEITNLPYLIEIAKTGGDVVMSTGMCEVDEIQAAVDVLKQHGAGKITLLHCNTEYPTPYEDANLRAMGTMRQAFQCPVGYSDHTPGIEAPIAAAALGAVIIEKHFTLDRNMEGPDHKASLEPDELSAMVRGIRRIEKAMGDGAKKVSPSEKKNIAIARKSIVARRSIKKGETMTEENLAVKRPGTGISPMRWFEVLGTKAIRDFEKDELIEW